MYTGTGWVGAPSLDEWKAFSENEQRPAKLDVVLVTHPRDEHDLPRLFPWSERLSLEERRETIRHFRPIFGEIISLPAMNIGIMFLPFFAADLIDPSTRARCRHLLQSEALDALTKTGPSVFCLGGLTGALSMYGKKLVKPAEERNLTMTTGHAATTVSVMETYRRVVESFDRDPGGATMCVLGIGSIGSSFCRLLTRQEELPRTLVLVDQPSRRRHAENLASELTSLTDSSIDIRVESTNSDGNLPADSTCYDCDYLISAISTPYVVDIARVAPGTVLVDDSQPYCWRRDEAWKRISQSGDIIACEAGLVDCGSIGFRSHFPFDFADHDENGSCVSWSCLAEGILYRLAEQTHDALPTIVGEPGLDALSRYQEAFKTYEFGVPTLQCGNHELPGQRKLVYVDER